MYGQALPLSPDCQPMPWPVPASAEVLHAHADWWIVILCMLNCGMQAGRQEPCKAFACLHDASHLDIGIAAAALPSLGVH